MEDEQPLQGARLRPFLLVARIVGLLVALSLTRLHQEAPNLPLGLQNSRGLLSFAVLAYHIVAGLVVLRAQGVLIIPVILLDLVVGFVMGFFCGSPYLILGFMLPVLEAATFFGQVAGLFLLVLGGLFYGGVLALPLLQIVKESRSSVPEDTQMAAQVAAQVNGAKAIASLQLAGVQGILSGLFLWVCLLVVSERQVVEQIEIEANREKELLYQKFQSKSQEFGKVIGEVGERETAVLSLKGQMAMMQAEKERLEDQLLAAGDDLESLKLLNQRLEKGLTEKDKAVRDSERRYEKEMHSQKTGLERDHFVIQKKYDKLGRLMAICKELNQNLGLNETLLALTTQLQAVLPCQSCVIFMVDEVDGHKELFPEVAASPYPDAFRNRVYQFDEDAPGWCAAQRRPLRIDDGSVQMGDRVLSTLTPHERSALVCPLATPQQVLGAIYLGRVDSQEFSPEEGEFLIRIAEFASLSLANSLEYQRRISHGLNDAVTKLYNGLFLEERMKEEVMRGRRYTYPVSLILVDIDGFGKAVGAMGEALAEKVLNEVADIIRQAIRETDVPARLEADDFAILLVHAERDKARAIADRIRAAVETRVFSSAQAKFKFTVSAGIAGVPHDGTSSELLKKRATEGLALARSKGGNKACSWDDAS